MNLPDTWQPIQIDTPTGTIPRSPILAPGGLAFYCPCCTGVIQPMSLVKFGDNGLGIFRCYRCRTVLTARKVPGVRM